MALGTVFQVTFCERRFFAITPNILLIVLLTVLARCQLSSGETTDDASSEDVLAYANVDLYNDVYGNDEDDVYDRVICRREATSGRLSFAERCLIQTLHRRGKFQPDLQTHYRPVRHGGRMSRDSAPVSIDVTMEINVNRMLGLNEKQQTFGVVGWHKMRWRDELITWNPDQFDGITELQLAAKDVWTPPIGLDNHADAVYDKSYRESFFVTYNSSGGATWRVGGVYTTSCIVELEFYPFDAQTCHLSFQSYSHDTHVMRITSNQPHILFADYLDTQEWSIGWSQACSSERIYSSHNFSTVDYFMHIKRYPSADVIHLLLPMALINILGLVSYLLPPLSGEKVALSVDLLLAFIFTQLAISAAFPTISRSIPYFVYGLGLYSIASMLNVAVTIIVLKYYFEVATDRRPERLAGVPHAMNVDERITEHLISQQWFLLPEPTTSTSSADIRILFLQTFAWLPGVDGADIADSLAKLRQLTHGTVFNDRRAKHMHSERQIVRTELMIERCLKEIDNRHRIRDLILRLQSQRERSETTRRYLKEVLKLNRRLWHWMIVVTQQLVFWVSTIITATVAVAFFVGFSISDDDVDRIVRQRSASGHAGLCDELLTVFNTRLHKHTWRRHAK